jgi:hypothetical protein
MSLVCADTRPAGVKWRLSSKADASAAVVPATYAMTNMGSASCFLSCCVELLMLLLMGSGAASLACHACAPFVRCMLNQIGDTPCRDITRWVTDLACDTVS